MSKIKKIAYFNVDYLRVQFENVEIFRVLENSVNFLDNDNSNFCRFWFFDLEFIVTRSQNCFMLKPLGFEYSVLRVDFRGGTSVKIDLYSSFFYWSDSEKWLKYMILYPHRVLRVDIACDIENMTVKQVADLFETKLSRTLINEKNDEPETLYIGDWKSKRKLIRVYDKKLDSLAKRKTDLFPDYFVDGRAVTRLEVELRNQACVAWDITLEKVLHIEFLYDLFVGELQTQFVYIELPLSVFDFYKKPSFERGEPDAEKRFWEAMLLAQKKGVDIVKQVGYFTKGF